MAIVPFRASYPNPYSPSYNEYYPVEYFSGFDLSIFFAGTYIDEIFELEYGLQERKIPVYSYANYTPSRIVTGTRIVQGSFAINMRPGDYLHELVNSITSQGTLGTTATAAASSTTQNLTPNPNATYAAPNPQIDPSGYATWVANQKALNWGASTQAATAAPDLSKVPYFTANDFQILLVYGDIDAVDVTARNSGRIRSIEGVSISSVGQSIGLDGSNIVERFTFIGKDINSPNRLGVD